jgi:hypothetical protein
VIGIVVSLLLVALLLVASRSVSFAPYLLLTLTVSTAGGLLVGRRSAVYGVLGALSAFGLLKAWGDVYLFKIKPGSHPDLIVLISLNLALALVCAGATAAGVRVRRTYGSDLA